MYFQSKEEIFTANEVMRVAKINKKDSSLYWQGCCTLGKWLRTLELHPLHSREVLIVRGQLGRNETVLPISDKKIDFFISIQDKLLKIQDDKNHGNNI